MENKPSRAVRSLPDDYVQQVRLSAKDRRSMLVLNIAGFVFLFLFGGLFVAIALQIRPEDTAAVLPSHSGKLPSLTTIFSILVIFWVMIYLHEGIHGLGFWLATKTRPVFGLRLYYAYAAAPEWYIPRNQFLLISLAPLLLLSAVYVFLMAVVPREFILAIIALAAMKR